MKLKLVKCMICNAWRLKLADDHCAICGAHKIMVGSGRFIHVNALGIEMVNGQYRIHLTEGNKLAIARVLAED